MDAQERSSCKVDYIILKEIFLLKMQNSVGGNHKALPIPVVVRSKGAGLQPLDCWNAGSIPAAGMDFRLLCLLCVV